MGQGQGGADRTILMAFEHGKEMGLEQPEMLFRASGSNMGGLLRLQGPTGGIETRFARESH
jgi:hypothetical protein